MTSATGLPELSGDILARMPPRAREAYEAVRRGIANLLDCKRRLSSGTASADEFEGNIVAVEILTRQWVEAMGGRALCARLLLELGVDVGFLGEQDGGPS